MLRKALPVCSTTTTIIIYFSANSLFLFFTIYDLQTSTYYIKNIDQIINNDIIAVSVCIFFNVKKPEVTPSTGFVVVVAVAANHHKMLTVPEPEVPNERKDWNSFYIYSASDSILSDPFSFGTSTKAVLLF